MLEKPPSDADRDVVAVFDFDKTLSTRDCVLPFLRRHLSLWKAVSAGVDLPKLGLALLRRDRNRVKAIATNRILKGLAEDELRQDARDYAGHVFDHWMRQDTLEKLGWHKDQGHRIGIVSASYSLYLVPIADRLGVDFVLATDLEFDDANRTTGRLLGENCRGPEKSRRITEWLEARGSTEALLFAYGDSIGDREMLAMAEHACVIERRAER